MSNYLLNLLINYGLKLFLVLIYEIKYIFLGYKGNNINLLNNKLYTDNIPIPYFFLEKINIFLKKKNLKCFVDLGAGSGRIIFFLNKKYPDAKIISYEINKTLFKKTSELFKNNKNIKIINKNFLNFKSHIKIDDPVVYFLNDPLKKTKEYENLFKQLYKKIRKTGYIITININQNLKFIKKKLIQAYMIKSKNYKIYEIKK